MSGFPVQPAHQLPLQPPEHRWLIQDLWSSGAVGIIGGEPKCYKSFLALGMGVAVASGRPCLGTYEVSHPGRVLLYAAEDAAHIVRERLDGIAAHHRLDLAELDLWAITAPAIRIDAQEHRRQLDATVAEMKPTLLILDPFVRLHRVDENVSAAVAPLLAFLRQLQRTHGCAVMLVHHTRKNAGNARAGQTLRGSSELHAWGDSNLYLRRQRKCLRLTIEHRAHRAPEDVALDLIPGPAGGMALGVIDMPDDGDHRHRAPDPPEQRVLDVLKEADTPLQLRELRQRCRIRNETLCRTLRMLEVEQHIIRRSDGWVAGEGDLSSSSRRASSPNFEQQCAIPLPDAPIGRGGTGTGNRNATTGSR